MLKTVLVVDLVAYMSLARHFEETIGPQAVAMLDAQIQRFVDQGLQHVKLSRELTVMVTTGDGAILLFDKASDAHKCAVAVHKATTEHNATRTEDLAKRQFRIGAATGDLSVQGLD